MNSTLTTNSARARLKTMLMRLSVPTDSDKTPATATLKVHSSRDESGSKFSLAAKVAMTALIGASLFCHNDPAQAQNHNPYAQQSTAGYGVPVFANPQMQRDSRSVSQVNTGNGYMPVIETNRLQTMMRLHKVTPEFVLQIDQRAPETYNALVRFPESAQVLNHSQLPPKTIGLLASCIETKLKILGHPDHAIRDRATALMLSKFTVQSVDEIQAWSKLTNQPFELGVAAYCMEGPTKWQAQADIWISRVKDRSAQVGDYVLNYLGARAIGDAHARTEAQLSIDRDLFNLDRYGAGKPQNAQSGEIYHVASTQIQPVDVTAEKPEKLAASQQRQ